MAEGDKGTLRGRVYDDILAKFRAMHPDAELLEARYREQGGRVDVRITLRFPSWAAVRKVFAS